MRPLLTLQQVGFAYGYRISTFLNFEFQTDFRDLRAWTLKVCAGTLSIVMHEREKPFRASLLRHAQVYREGRRQHTHRSPPTTLSHMGSTNC
jgi:hypothetical protein